MPSISTQVFLLLVLLAFECIGLPHAKYEQNSLKCQFIFFHNIGPNLAQILPQRPYCLYFFLADFHQNMLRDIAEITKADHQLSETFYFIKISYVLTELLIFFYLSDVFCQKSVISRGSHQSSQLDF